MYSSIRKLIFGLALVSFAFGASYAEENKEETASKEEPAKKEMKDTKNQGKKAEEEKFIYMGDKYKDPFIPLTGTGTPVIKGLTKGKITLDPSTLMLKGIITTKTGRIAMLKQMDGNQFIIKNGKIHDPKKNIVEGYAGIVKEDSVVIIDSDKTVTELKIRDEAKTEGRINIKTIKQ